MLGDATDAESLMREGVHTLALAQKFIPNIFLPSISHAAHCTVPLFVAALKVTCTPAAKVRVHVAVAAS